MCMSKSHGGKRAGSGRKPISKSEPTQRRTATLLVSHVHWLRSRRANLSLALRELIEQEQKRNDEHDKNPV